ncbi:MAG: MarR family transcriptional regulator [Myxococcota bacterium]|nr:MarR family transcriptional regulator [Myxococcota bacterium]
MTHPLDLEQQLCFALYTASRLTVRAYRPLLEELSITYPQYLVLLVLWQAHREGAPAPTVRGLGEKLYLDSGTLTPLLKRLEARGLVTRERSTADEREVHVVLTKEGRSLHRRAKKIPEALACAYDQPPRDLFALRDQLKSLIARLETP